jgi:hypothetical protein
MNEFEKITPETFEKINQELIEEDNQVRIEIPTQEQIDKWRSWVDDNPMKPIIRDQVAESWEKLGIYTMEQREQYRKDH